MAVPFCVGCQRRLEGGFLLDQGSNGNAVTKWVEGAPEKSFWLGLKITGRRSIPVYAWRCPGCAEVRLFAPDA
jgi:hypothetical protein